MSTELERRSRLILCLCVGVSGAGLHWGKGAIRKKCQLDSSKGPNCYVRQIHIDHWGLIRFAHFTFIEGLVFAKVPVKLLSILEKLKCDLFDKGPY